MNRMNNTRYQREYFFAQHPRLADAAGDPLSTFLADLFQPQLAVNSAEPSWWLTLFNDFIHAFRMGAFRHLRLFLLPCCSCATPLEKWWKVRVRTGRYSDADRYPTADAAALLCCVYVNGKACVRTGNTSLPGPINLTPWRVELISHLWALLCWWC